MRHFAGAAILDFLAEHRCDLPTCSTCDLFLAIPDSATPAYAAWRAGLREQLLTDPHILSLCPDLVLWLLSQRSDDGNE